MKTALLVIPIDAPGGAETIAATLAATLASLEGWQVYFVVLASNQSQFYGPGLPRSVQVSYGKGGGRVGSEFTLLPLLRARMFDFVYASHMRINTFLSVARRLGLLRCGRLVTRESTVLADRYAGIRRLLYRSGYCLYGGQDLIVAQSAYMAQTLKSTLGSSASSKVVVVVNPVDLEDIRRQTTQAVVELPERGELMLWCGRLVPVKRPHVALEVLLELRAQGRDVHLVMVGDGPLAPTLQQRANELSLSAHITFAGQLDNPYAVFSSCDYGLITSASEGFPNVLLEMLGCGVSSVYLTPCTDGVETLPGARVAVGFTADDLVSIFNDECDTTPDKEQLEKALLQRSPENFAQVLLGEPSGVSSE